MPPPSPCVLRPPRPAALGPLVLGPLLLLLAPGCAREALPALPPTSAALRAPQPQSSAADSLLPPHLARIPPPVAPYVWPDSLDPVALTIPQWAGRAAAPFAATVQRAAAYYQLPPALIWAVMKVESDFRHRAVSRAGARGLMQLMPSTARAFGVRDLFDPEQNILGGAYYLRHLANRFRGDIYFTLAAYNAGPTAVRRHGGIPPFRETRNFVRKVLTYYASSTPVSVASLEGSDAERASTADGS